MATRAAYSLATGSCVMTINFTATGRGFGELSHSTSDSATLPFCLYVPTSSHCTISCNTRGFYSFHDNNFPSSHWQGVICPYGGLSWPATLFEYRCDRYWVTPSLHRSKAPLFWHMDLMPHRSALGLGGKNYIHMPSLQEWGYHKELLRFLFQASSQPDILTSFFLI